MGISKPIRPPFNEVFEGYDGRYEAAQVWPQIGKFIKNCSVDFQFVSVFGIMHGSYLMFAKDPVEAKGKRTNHQSSPQSEVESEGQG